MYFETLIGYLQDGGVAGLKIVHPFSLYLICNHYYGNEFNYHGGNLKSLVGLESKNDILRSNDVECVKENDIIHVQVNYFAKFVDTILPRLKVRFVLSTGQWHKPQIHKNTLTDGLLNDSRIIAWISQNPIYKHPKYIAFPYGIRLSNLESYKSALLFQPPKTEKLVSLFIDRSTNACRKALPLSPDCVSTSPDEFYRKVSGAEFILSPIGDRMDCYRHYEAIGLGTTPISNVTTLYTQIFEESMIYMTIDAMATTDASTCGVSNPDRNLICFDYHLNRIHESLTRLSK